MNTKQGYTKQSKDSFSYKAAGRSREYSIKRGVATQSIDDLVKQGLDLLYNQLDNLMKIFKRRDPQFYHGYVLARTIVDD
jgi:hypothetical protein